MVTLKADYVILEQSKKKLGDPIIIVFSTAIHNIFFTLISNNTHFNIGQHAPFLVENKETGGGGLLYPRLHLHT